MNQLIPIHHSGPEFFVNSRDVAATFRLTHKHLREQIEEHVTDLERLGVLPVESAKPAWDKGGRLDI